MLSLNPVGDMEAFTAKASAKSQSVVYLTAKDRILAAIAVADVVREESKQAVEVLQSMGIEVAMLTGDSRSVAEAVSKELGIQRVFAEVLPEHKDQKVTELQKMGKRVAMVGDGVNDAPALTRADVGIAIGGGTDVAIESAGLILVNSNPLDVVKIFRLSRASYRKMIQNLWWAAGYNIVAIPLAAGVLGRMGNPALACSGRDADVGQHDCGGGQRAVAARIGTIEIKRRRNQKGTRDGVPF
jgi:P-type Cu2+ transporter